MVTFRQHNDLHHCFYKQTTNCDLEVGFFVSNVFNDMWMLKTCICVFPHITDSRMASWRICTDPVAKEVGGYVRMGGATGMRCLEHLHLSSHLPDGTSYVHQPLLLYLLQHCVYCNQSSHTSHTSTVGSK